MPTLRRQTVLKWAGNKTRITGEILSRLPTGKRLVEPFTGSAAVFMQADYPSYLLAEGNADLTSLYSLLKSHGEALIEATRSLFTPDNNQHSRYLALREEFNHSQQALRRAALFIYLNRHGYNGLCRYNKKGGFNVPFGSYKSPLFPEEQMRRFMLKAKHAKVVQQDFSLTMQQAKAGDVIYCDPPYLPLSATANFTAYDKNDFSLTQQQQLADLAMACRQRGIPVLISNHDTPLARTLYADAQITTLQVDRFISCKVGGRGKIGELLALYMPE